MIKIDKIKVAYIHCHTKYSARDSTNEIRDYIEKIKELNKNSAKYEITGLGVSEHGLMTSALKVTLACEKTKKEDNIDIKHIVGFEAYHCYNYSQLANKTTEIPSFHLVLMARNEEGKKNLFKLATIAGNHKKNNAGKQIKPLLDLPTLKQYGKGIIASSACISGLIPKLIIENKIQDATDYAIEFATAFDKFYLEIQPHTIPEQLIVNEKLVEISDKTGIPLVMGVDSHYKNREDKRYHDALMAINGMTPYSVEAYMYSFEELEQYCIDYNIPLQAIYNTGVIADDCDVSLKLKPTDDYMPQYPVPVGYNDDTYLRKVCMDNLYKKAKEKGHTDIIERLKRLNYELSVISTMGFSGYFLIVWDWFEWCKKNDIILGFGRGSAAGSITCYNLGITSIDPIKNKYLFERFLNINRQELPDIDSDCSTENRSKALSYFEQKYGLNNVSQIITVGQYKIKSVFRAAASMYGMSGEEITNFSKVIPSKLGDDDATYTLIKEVYDNPSKYSDKYSDKEINSATSTYIMLEDLFTKYPQMYDAVLKLCNLVASYGLHAGGVLISKQSLTDNFPMTTGSDSAVLPLIQFDMDDIHYFGILKLDALGLKSSDIVKKCMDVTGLGWDWYYSEDVDDANVYKFLREGNTANVFQFSSVSATKLIKDCKIDGIGRLTDSNALNRPGCIAIIKLLGNKSMLDLYKEGVEGNVYSIDRATDEILKDTNGCVIYQEQCMELARVIAGYDLAASDSRVRRPIAKKLRHMIPELEVEFIYGKKPMYIIDDNGKYELDDKGNKKVLFKNNKDEIVDGYEQDGRPVEDKTQDSEYCRGALANGCSLETAIKVFDIFREMASYAFNRPHAGVYAYFAYKSAYLSLYYPTEFYYSCLAVYKDPDKIKDTISKAKRRGIKFLPPDINKSQETFSLEDDSEEKKIRYGLVDIMDVGGSVTKLILTERNANGPFKDFNDFIDRIINKNSQTVKDYLWDGQKYKTNPLNKGGICALIKAGAFDYCEPNRFVLLNLYNTQINKDKAWVMLDESKYVRADKLAFEKDRMKVYISEHPLDPFPYEDLSKITAENTPVVIAGEVKSKESKKGKKSSYLQLKVEFRDDSVGIIRLFGKAKDNYSKVCKEGAILVFTGRYSPEWGNISCDRVQEIVAITGQPANILELEDAFSPVPIMPGIDSTNLVDMLLGANK